MGNPAATQCVVFKNGTVTMMARVDNDAGTILNQASVTSVAYSVYLLDADYPANPDTRTVVTGHDAATVAKTACIFDTLQTAAPWDSTLDASGYNFKHTLVISTYPAFTIAGRTYLVEWIITPTSGQVVVFHFTPTAI